MSLKCFTYAFNKKESVFWPTLERRQLMPASCTSAHNPGDGRLGLGLVEAASVLLAGQVRLGRRRDAFSVRYESNRGGRRVASSAPSSPGTRGPAAGMQDGRPVRRWEGTDAMKGPPLLAIVEAVLLETTGGGPDPILAETRSRWTALLEELEVEVGEPAPYAREQLCGASRSRLCRRAMMALTDSVYFALKRSDAAGTRAFLKAGGQEFPALPPGDCDRLFDRPAPDRASSGGKLARTLEGLVETGGTALLVGPTGTFKTTTAARVAHETGCALQVVKGRPGIEDRDFFGGVTPTERGPQWVDGPVTRAFRKARSRSTMLLMDELLRFEPLYLGALVGLLDAASPAELEARAIDPAPGFAAAPHYVAELPTGERIACPASRLTLVATTNMGSGYVQAARLDAALMGRFELCVEVETPDPHVKRRLYEEAAGVKGADLLEAIEEAVEAGHIDRGGLYVRRAHPRLMLNMAKQMSRLTTSGDTGEKEAAREAARVTVVPACVERQASGLLDPSGRDSLLAEVADCAEAIL